MSKRNPTKSEMKDEKGYVNRQKRMYTEKLQRMNKYEFSAARRDARRFHKENGGILRETRFGATVNLGIQTVPFYAVGLKYPKR